MSAPRNARLRSGDAGVAAPKTDASMADHISSLPDELLHAVLSLLPAHELLATCVLARRWRDLWKSTPALRITGVDCCDDPDLFIDFVNNLLVFHRDPDARLDTLELDLRLHDDERDLDPERPAPAFLPDNEAYVNLWLRHALLRGARTLALRTALDIYTGKEDAEAMEMPNAPLISRRLTRLDLQLVHLPTKTLDFLGCPTLKHLRMEDCNIEGDIIAPSLKHLCIIFGFFLTGSVRARVCLPSLVSLELIDVRCRAPLLERMPLLVSAIVRLSELNDSCPRSYWGDCGVPHCSGCYDSASGADDRRGESLLLEGLSEAAELELSVDSQVFVVNRDLKLCPTFSKLKTLLLNEWCPGTAGDCHYVRLLPPAFSNTGEAYSPAF